VADPRQRADAIKTKICVVHFMESPIEVSLAHCA
jgi:hypothetical protein